MDWRGWLLARFESFATFLEYSGGDLGLEKTLVEEIDFC
jgi:hypothetical protein